jgi:hypothetical protein
MIDALIIIFLVLFPLYTLFAFGFSLYLYNTTLHKEVPPRQPQNPEDEF